MADTGGPRTGGAVTEEQIDDIRRRLSHAVTRVCPRWLSTHSEDIVQVAILRVLNAAKGRGEGPPDLSSLYVEKTAYSALVDEIRRHRRRREESVEGKPDVAGDRSDGDPESAVGAREVAEGLRGCLAVLGGPRKLAVTLHLQGHSVPEVAAILKWRDKRAENLVYRGLADLRRCLSMKGLGR